MEAATATENKSITFTSRCANQVLTLKPPRNRKNSEGDTIDRIPGVKIEFEDHRATVEEDSYGRILVNGRHIEADVDEPDGSTHPVTYEWILDRLIGNEEKRIAPHRNLNKGVEHDAFYYDEPKPEPEPRLDDQLGAITRAAVDRDVDVIEAVIQIEKETHNRDIVLVQANAALQQIAEEED